MKINGLQQSNVSSGMNEIPQVGHYFMKRLQGLTLTVVRLPGASETLVRTSENATLVARSDKYFFFHIQITFFFFVYLDLLFYVFLYLFKQQNLFHFILKFQHTFLQIDVIKPTLIVCLQAVRILFAIDCVVDLSTSKHQ